MWKKGFLKKICGMTLAAVMLITILPDMQNPVQAAGEANWIHMSDTEKETGFASYDADKDEITFKLGSWFSRMQYVGLSDTSGKDWTIEFDMSVEGGAIGVYNFEGSGALYGVYLDTNAAALDAVQFSDWSTCLDNFYFLEEGKQPLARVGNWVPATDKPGSRIRVDFIRGIGGTLAGGKVIYYKRNADAGEYVLLGEVTIPNTVADHAELPNFFGIHLYAGIGTVSNITIKEYQRINWEHMSTAEKKAGKAAYDVENDSITFQTDAGWSGRMRYLGLPDVSGRDYAIEFDLNVNGGAVGVYCYEASGALFGVYLDMGARALDTLRFTDWVTCVDDFRFREVTSGAAIVHPQIPCSNWNAGDNAGSRLRVEFALGENGTLAGGTVTYYKRDNTTGEYLILGSAAVPDDLKDNPELANQFGIQLWLGEGTVSNIVVYDTLTVGGGDTKTNEISVSVAVGGELPTGYVEDKYIIGWSVDGQKVTVYNGEAVKPSQYTADFIDTDMLKVKWQDNSDALEEGATKLNARFVSSVNSLEYKTAGFVFSLTDPVPEAGKTGCVVKDTTKVYKSLMADGEVRYVSDEYPGGYSIYMYAFVIKNIPDGTPIYVRAYVELEDGTIVYGDARSDVTVKIR